MKDTILDIAHRELLGELLMKHLTFSVAPVEEMVHYLKPTMQELMGTNNAIKVGDWCEVLYDYAPGTRSDGGVGEVMGIDEDAEGVKSCRVSYVLDKRIETRIALNRITVTMMPYKDTTSLNRTRREQDISSSNILPDVKRSNFQNKRKNDKLGVSKLIEGMKKRVIWNKGQCVITNRAASRKKYNARYFFSRMKALNVATIPEFKEGRL